MYVFDMAVEEHFEPSRHVEKVLGTLSGGDFSIACWEPGQTSPFHCHPEAVEIYFCLSGGGKMHTPDAEVEIKPGSFVVHPKGELHEYVNGSERSVLFRVRYGANMYSRAISWASNPDWRQRPEDKTFFSENGP